jgi:formylglycine-generating enzyme required for sulfatase activity
LEVTGGTFYRSYNPVSWYVDGGTRTPQLGVGADGGPTGLSDPATISSFRLDKYLVTVGRFRQFLSAWNNGSGVPQEGSGKHTHLNGGRGLANAASPGTYEVGWLASYNSLALELSDGGYCDTPTTTWAAAGSNETLPTNCLTWYGAYAFCNWDGGFLPSEAEWGYAAAGGSQQREYPWGTNAPGTASQYAIYGCYYPNGSGTCGLNVFDIVYIAPVGTASLGTSLWGQLDLAGELMETLLDDWSRTYVDPCTDCAYLDNNIASAYKQVVGRGGFYTAFNALGTVDLGASTRGGSNPAPTPSTTWGFRCARTP